MCLLCEMPEEAPVLFADFYQQNSLTSTELLLHWRRRAGTKQPVSISAFTGGIVGTHLVTKEVIFLTFGRRKIFSLHSLHTHSCI